jgi:hypothetical protein
MDNSPEWSNAYFLDKAAEKPDFPVFKGIFSLARKLNKDIPGPGEIESGGET